MDLQTISGNSHEDPQLHHLLGDRWHALHTDRTQWMATHVDPPETIVARCDDELAKLGYRVAEHHNGE